VISILNLKEMEKELIGFWMEKFIQVNGKMIK